MTVVLDASALLAVILEESGADRVLEAGPNYLMSAVNFGEVLTKIVERGGAIADVQARIAPLAIRLQAFGEVDAIEVARLRPLTRHLGRSFGDRACLGLAGTLGVPLLTADGKWSALDIGVDIIQIR